MLTERASRMSGLPSLLLSLIAALPAGCATAPADPLEATRGTILFPRAWVVREDADLAAACEEHLSRSCETPPAPGEPWLRVLPGRSGVLVTAPHATAPTREGQPRGVDTGTGSLAVMLNALAGTPAIYTARLSPSDPNYDDDNDFKRTLARLLDERQPRVVLDLHASHPSRPYDVDFGTMGGTSLGPAPELLPRLARALQADGLSSFSQDYFAASRNRTVTRFVAARGVPAVQLEINGTWLLRPGARDLPRQRFAQLLQGLVRFAAAVDGRALPDRRGPPSADPAAPCAISGS